MRNAKKRTGVLVMRAIVAAAVGGAVCAPMQAAIWNGATAGTAVGAGTNWSNASNWTTTSGEVLPPNGAGAVAEFGIPGSVASFLTGALVVQADAATSTANVRFGNLVLHDNQSLILGGGTTDVQYGRYVVKGAGSSAATMSAPGIDTAGRGIVFAGSVTDAAALESDLDVDLQGGLSFATLSFNRPPGASATIPGAVFGGGFTIRVTSTRGRLEMVSGANDSLQFVTLDLRSVVQANMPAETFTDRTSNHVLALLANYAGGTNSVVQLGSGQIVGFGNMQTNHDFQLTGPVTFMNTGAAGRAPRFNGILRDDPSATSPTKVTIINNSTGGGQSVSFGGGVGAATERNTYSGGTVLRLVSAANASQGLGTFDFSKAGAVGTGDMRVEEAARLRFFADLALGTGPLSSTNGLTLLATSNLALIELNMFDQVLEFTAVETATGTNLLAPGVYSAAGLELALEAAGMPTNLAVTTTGVDLTAATWTIVPIPEPTALAGIWCLGAAVLGRGRRGRMGSRI